jgi:hypothetical protein
LTPEVKPDVYPPASYNELSVGWYAGYNNVSPACSSSVYHGINKTSKTDSQGPIMLYSTKTLALKALRRTIEERCLDELFRVDNLFEELQ